MSEEGKIVDIDAVGNYYGGIRILEKEDGSYQWSITNWDGDYWVDMPEYLANALLQYQQQCEDARGDGK